MMEDQTSKVYYSKEELMSDPTLSEEERAEIMSKGKTTVQVDKNTQRTAWYRSNNNENRYRGSNSSNKNQGAYNEK